MFGFVVLHYMAYDMTVECVSTLIQHFGDQNIKIVVVDNASSNGSGKMLASKYQDDCRVEVILNPQNEGFARGNNVGYNYLVVYDNPDYIIVMNNDVLIEQEDFLDRIEQIYQDTSFAVLGPDIYNACSGKHQNPAYLKGFTKGEVRTMYRRAVLGCLFIRVLYWKVNLIKGLRTRNLWRKASPHTIEHSTTMEDVVLHGACYIFSQDFIRRRPYCFLPGTFLYMEENILYYECMRDGLKIVYSPIISVTHLDDVATNAAIKSDYQKFKMKKNESRKSKRVFLEQMEKDEKLGLTNYHK